MRARASRLGRSWPTAQGRPSAFRPAARNSPSIPTSQEDKPNSVITRASSSTPKPLAIAERSRRSGASRRALRNAGSSWRVCGGWKDARPASDAMASKFGEREPAPSPQALTRSPTPMSSAPSDSSPISRAASSTRKRLRGMLVHSPRGVRFRRSTSESGRQGDISASTASTAPCRRRASADSSRSSLAWNTADQRAPIAGPLSARRAGAQDKASASVDIFEIPSVGPEGREIEAERPDDLFQRLRDGPRHVASAAHENLGLLPDQTAQPRRVGGDAVLHVGGVARAARECGAERRQAALRELFGEFVLVEEVRRGRTPAPVQVNRTAARRWRARSRRAARSPPPRRSE